MIKLLIVDDSALMRRQLTQMFEAEGGFTIRSARNGVEAVEENRAFGPDVVTLDINMPEMDGLTALSMLMTERPVPVVMFSSLTEKGALATFEALNLGAVDYVAKPGGTISLSIDDIRRELVDKVRAAARAKLKIARNLTQRLRQEREVAVAKAAAPRKPERKPGKNGVVVIGVSTGGPRTLEDILPQLPADFPYPVLVAQHMPANFTRAFAARMNDLCELTVSEAAHPAAIEPGNIYIGKGGADLVVAQRGSQLTALAKPERAEFLWHPSVELLVRSTLEHYDPTRVIGVMLTGMGDDGADAMAELKRRGGRTIAESEASCVVFGMPSELIKRDGASVVLSSEKIAPMLIQWAERD